MGDIAQRTVRSTKSGTDPICEFAAQRTVGVVDADKSKDSCSRDVGHTGLVLPEASPLARKIKDLMVSWTGVPVEPARQRWTRRAKTIPAMLGLTIVAIGFGPILIPGAILYDLVRARTSLPTLRVYAFVCQYLVNDSIEIILAGPLWILAGFGTRLNQTSSRTRHVRLQAWSIAVLARRAETLLGIRLHTDVDIDSVLAPGPAIVVCRHVSLFDASLPALLYQRLGIHTRTVIMAELLADPGFDLLYQRVGSVFIQRDDVNESRRQAAQLGDGLDPTTVAVIFPEGRLFRPDLLAHFIERLEQRDPARGERLTGLRHLLPPRPGGLIALLDAAPDADVVVINHAGFDSYPTFAQLARSIPLTRPIQISATRVHRDDIPDDPELRIRWLDHIWCDMDNWIHARSHQHG